MKQINGSHIVFLPANNSGLFNKARYMTEQEKALLITEKEGLGGRGAGINFVVNNDKIQYEVNKASLERSELKISNKLLTLAN